MEKHCPSKTEPEAMLPGGPRWGPLHSLADVTSSHGTKLMSRGRGPIRVLSFVIFCVFLAISMRVTVQNTIAFRKDLRGTRILHNVPISNNQSPVIFYCPTSRIDLTRLDPDIAKFISSNTADITGNKTFSDIISGDRIKHHLLKFYENMTYTEFTLRHSFLRKENKTKCYIGWDTPGIIDCNSETSFVLTERGVCYQVNAADKDPEGPLGTISFTTVLDLTSSLKVELDSGFEVFIKDLGSLPNRFDKSNVLAPGLVHTITVTLEEFINMPGRHNKATCYPNSSPGPFYPLPFYGPPESSTRSCYAANSLFYLNKTLGCIDVPNKHTHSMRLCTLRELAKIMDNFAEITLGPNARRLIKKEIARRVHPHATGCLPACRTKHYRTLVHSTPINPAALQPLGSLLGTTQQQTLSSITSIRVVFPRTKTMVEEIRTYTLGNYLGDIGGIFGLFLGISLFTFIEFVYFGSFYLVKWACRGLRGNWLRDLESLEETGKTKKDDDVTVSGAGMTVVANSIYSARTMEKRLQSNSHISSC